MEAGGEEAVTRAGGGRMVAERKPVDGSQQRWPFEFNERAFGKCSSRLKLQEK